MRRNRSPRFPQEKKMATHAEPGNTTTPSMQPCTYTREDARVAVDKYFDLLGKAIKTIPTGGVPFSENLKRYSEMNIETAREYMHQLGQAKHFAEVLRIQM